MSSPKSSWFHGGVKITGVENVQQHAVSASKLQVAASQGHLSPSTSAAQLTPPRTSPVKEIVRKRSFTVAHMEVEGPRKRACLNEADEPGHEVSVPINLQIPLAG